MMDHEHEIEDHGMKTDSESSFNGTCSKPGSEVPPIRTMRLEDVQEVLIHDSVAMRPCPSVDSGSSLTNSAINSGWEVKPAYPKDLLISGCVKECEKNASSNALIWHKVEYSLAKNGLIYRKKLHSRRELVPFDLRAMDIDRMPRNIDPHSSVESGRTLQSIRLMKFHYDGSELIWYMKTDDVETMADWFKEMTSWKNQWHQENWRENLYVQTEKVPLNPEKDNFDLAATVALERDTQMKNAPFEQSSSFISSLDMMQ